MQDRRTTSHAVHVDITNLASLTFILFFSLFRIRHYVFALTSSDVE